MTLLDQFLCEQTEEEMYKIWDIIGEQKKIDQARISCVLRGEELEKEFF